MKIIGLIPARKGSKRIPGKNLKYVGGMTLLRRAIEVAHKSKVFDQVIVSTDWDECAGVAILNHAGWIERPGDFSGDDAHDFEWVQHALNLMPGYDIFMILRPTSPFRTKDTIIRALNKFIAYQPADSLRAVERTSAHPGKSWVLSGDQMRPYLPGFQKIGSYDMPTQSLETVYCQNGCIHVGWVSNIEQYGNVSGETILPYFTEGDEGIDINKPEDLQYAGWLMDQKQGPNDWRGQ